MKVTSKNTEGPISRLLLILVAVFVSFLMISNILANQMLQIGRFSMDAGTLTFPITYILSDVFSEVYGYKWSRRTAWIASAMNLILALLIMLSIYLPHPDWYDGSHFELAVGGSIRIVGASLLSYYLGDLVNDNIFNLMKRKQDDMKGFKLRAIVSSIGGEIVDSSVFVLVAFVGTMPTEEMLPMIAINIIVKTGYEIVILPVTALVAKKVKQAEELIGINEK